MVDPSPQLRCVRGSSLKGNIALALGWVSQEQLRGALAEQAVLSRSDRVASLGDILLSSGLVSRPQAASLHALKQAAWTMQAPYRIGSVALRAGWIGREQLREILKAGRRSPDAEPAGVVASAAGLGPEEMQRAWEVLRRIAREQERRGTSETLLERPLDERDEWRIGRAESCEIRLTDPDVSKLHARLVRLGGAWFVEDLGSRTGTLLDGKRLLGSAPLRPGQVLVVGNAAITVARPRSEPAEPELPRLPKALSSEEKRDEWRFAAAAFAGIGLALACLAAWRETAVPSNPAPRVASAIAAPAQAIVPEEKAAPGASEASRRTAEESLVPPRSPGAAPAPETIAAREPGPAAVEKAPEPVAPAAPERQPEPEPAVAAVEAPILPALLAHRARVGLTEGGRRQAIDDLLERDEACRDEARAILLEWRATSLKGLVRTSESLAFRRMTELRARLFELRLGAIAAIQSKSYTHTEGQEDVDTRVAAVRDFLAKNARFVLPALSSGQRTLLARVEWIDARLASLGAPPPALPRSILLRREGPVAFERFRLEWEPGVPPEEDDAARAANAARRGLVSEVEWEALEALNEYRAMLGRPLVRLDESLCLAARSQAAYMAKKGRLTHEQSEPGLKGPLARATHFGFRSDRLGIGENIAPRRSTGRAAFECFYNSAPHHRNMIRMHHRSIGVGHAAGWWCWDFGREAD